MHGTSVPWPAALAGAVRLLAGGPAAAIDITSLALIITQPGAYRVTQNQARVN